MTRYRAKYSHTLAEMAGVVRGMREFNHLRGTGRLFEAIRYVEPYTSKDICGETFFEVRPTIYRIASHYDICCAACENVCGNELANGNNDWKFYNHPTPWRNRDWDKRLHWEFFRSAELMDANEPAPQGTPKLNICSKFRPLCRKCNSNFLSFAKRRHPETAPVKEPPMLFLRGTVDEQEEWREKTLLRKPGFEVAAIEWLSHLVLRAA